MAEHDFVVCRRKPAERSQRRWAVVGRPAGRAHGTVQQGPRVDRGDHLPPGMAEA